MPLSVRSDITIVNDINKKKESFFSLQYESFCEYDRDKRGEKKITTVTGFDARERSVICFFSISSSFKYVKIENNIGITYTFIFILIYSYQDWIEDM